jgi:drug/metabolite transporter (DMT)-like permease
VVFYGFGVGCMIGAALMNGFVITYIASTYDGQPDAILETLKPIFVLCHGINQTLAQAGTVAISIAVLVWSLVLFGRGSAARVIAVLGVLVGAVPVAGLASGYLHLDVHGMGVVILLQAIWNIAVGVWLMREPALAGRPQLAPQ